MCTHKSTDTYIISVHTYRKWTSRIFLPKSDWSIRFLNEIDWLALAQGPITTNPLTTALIVNLYHSITTSLVSSLEAAPHTVAINAIATATTTTTSVLPLRSHHFDEQGWAWTVYEPARFPLVSPCSYLCLISPCFLLRCLHHHAHHCSPTVGELCELF